MIAAALDSLVREKRGVLLDEWLLIFRQIVDRLDRIRSADRYARATVNTTVGIDIHLRGRLESRFILLGVDAVRGADIYAQRVFDT